MGYFVLAEDRYGLFASFEFGVTGQSFTQMDRVVKGLRGIEMATKSSDQALQSASLGRQFQQVAAGVREMDSRTSQSINPLKALRQEFRALRAEARNIDFGGVGDTKMFRSATREVHQYVEALESLGHQVAADTTLEREFVATLKQQQRVAQQRVDMAQQQRKAVAASERLAGATAVQNVGQAAFAPLAGFEQDSIRILRDFSDQMSQVQAVSDLTAQQLESVRDKSKKLGAKTRFSASEAASGFVLLAQAGYPVEKQLAAIDGTLNLAAAGNLDLARATEITVSTLGQFQLGAEQATHAANVLAQAAAMGQIDVSDIGMSLKYAGISAKRAGLGIEQASSMLALLSEGGLKGEMAGTALGQMLDGLVAPASTGAAALKQLGVTTTDAQGKLLPYEKMLGQTIEALGKVSNESERAALTNKIFGVVGGRAAGILMPRFNKLATTTATIIKQSDQGIGAAQKQAAVMEDNIGGSFRNFSSAMEGVKVALIEPLEPLLRFIIDTGSAMLNFVTGLPAPFRVMLSVGVGLVTALTGLASVLGTVGVAAFGMQQAIATAGVGMVALRGSALPLTGFFETALAGFAGNPAAGIKQFGVALSGLPGPIGVTATSMRGFGAAMMSALLSPMGLAIAGFGLLLLVASHLAPGVDLLGASLTLLTTPLKILGSFLKGVGSGFQEALGGIFGTRLDPVVKDFTDFFDGVSWQIEQFQSGAENFGQVVGKGLAQIFVPLAKAQAAITRSIVSLWIGTIKSIMGAFSPLIRFAQAVGSVLVSLLAENSPGPTAQIREKWQMTVESIRNGLGQLPAVASDVGMAIWGAFKWVAEGTAELFRGLIGGNISAALIPTDGVLGKTMRHRFGEVLGDSMTAPMESGTENDVLSTFLLVADRVDETVALIQENLSLVPAALRGVLDKVVTRFGEMVMMVRNAEASFASYVTVFGKAIGVTGVLASLLSRYPRLIGGLATGLKLFGGFATGIGLILTLNDRLRLLRFGLVSVDKLLERFGISADWLDPVIKGLDSVIGFVSQARTTVALFLRSILFGQWDTTTAMMTQAFDALSSGVQAAIAPMLPLWNRLSEGVAGGRDRIVGAVQSVLEQFQGLKTGASTALEGVTQDPLGAAIVAVQSGLSFVQNLGVGIAQGVDGMLRQVLKDTFASLNGLGAAGLGVAFLSLFFVPAGIPQVIAAFLPLLIAGLSRSGVLERLQNWLSTGFKSIADQIDQRFGRQEGIHRLIDVFGQVDRVARNVGMALSNLVDNVLVRIGAAFTLMVPAVSGFVEGLAELYRVGGIGAVLGGLVVQAKSLVPILMAFKDWGSGLTAPIQAFVQSIMQIATTFPVVQRLLTMLEGVVAMAARLPAGQQMIAAGALAIAGGRRVMEAGGSAMAAGQQVAVTGIDRVIQLMMWIGTGVYQIARPGVEAVRKVPAILQVLSRILGVSTKILNPLPALIGLSGKAMGRDGMPRVTPIDILGRLLPDFLISGADKAVTGSKVRGVLEQRQAGFQNVDPFKQRELVGKYTERLANPLGLLNTPLFGSAAIASIELLGGSLLGLVGIVGIAAAALYVFKPAAAKPIFAAFRTIGNMVMGVAFVLTHLGQTVEKTGDALTILGFKMAAPQWAVNTTRAINAVISGIGAMAIAITNAVDFVFGIVPTLIRSAVLLVPLALMGVASLVLTAFRDLTARLITDTRVLGDAIVQGFQRGDWSSLGQILRQAFTNAFRVTLQPVLNLVKFLTWNMFLKPIGMAIGAVVGLFVGLGGSILDAVLHPVRLLKQLAGAVMIVGAAIAAIRIGAVVAGIVGVIAQASAVVETVASSAAVVAEAVGSSAAAVGGIAAVTTVALSPVVGILGAIAVAIAVVAGALVLGYRDGFESLIGMLVAIQHPIDFLNHAMSNLITLITTPVKPLNWLFSPISDFLGGIGKNLMKYFPLLIGAFFGLNIVRKGLINGMISGFMMVVNAITQITTAILGAIGAMVTLGRRSREYSKTLEGQVLQEGVKQKGSAVMQRLGIARPSAEPLAVRQEQERQFKEKSAIVRFRREIEKLKLQAEQEYGQAFMSLDPSYRVQEKKKALGGLVTYQGEGLSSKGKDLSRRGVAEDVRQGQNQFTDENLQAIAKKVGLNMGEVPGLLNLRELVTAKADKMEEVQDLYSQSIANIRLAEMQIKSAQVEIVADNLRVPLNLPNPNVVDLGAARAAKVAEQRKLRTTDDVLSLPFSPESIQQMSRLPGAENLRVMTSGQGSTDVALSAEVRKMVEQLQSLQDTRDGKEIRLADVSLSMVKSLAAEMGVYQERTARDPDYRFMQTYEGHQDKQGVPAITKQLLMLQMMAKTGQIANPEELAKGFIGPADALKTIHNAMDNLQKASKTRDENQAEMLMQSAMTSLKANFNFLKGDEIGRLVTSLSEDMAGPDEAMKALRLVLGRQVDLILANSPVVAVAQATQEVASSMNAATAQVVQQTQQIEKGAASSGIGGFFKAVVERAKRIQRDINDSDTVTRMRDNAREGQRYRDQAAQSTHVKQQLAATSQTIGASGQVDFMRKIGVLQDPTVKIIEGAEQQVSKALNVAMTKQQEELLHTTIRTISTTSAKDVMGKLQPEALAALTAYARQLDPSLTVESLLNAMRSKGKGLSDETNNKLKASLPAFDAPNLKEFFKQIGLVTVEQVPLDSLGKQYKELIQQKYMPDIQRIEGGAVDEISPPVKAALSKYAKDYGLNLKDLVDQIRTLETHDIIQTMREAGAIQELANPGAVERFFKSANVKVPSTTLDTPEAKAALKLMRGNLSNINSEVTQGVLRTIARSANVDVSQLIDPAMTPAKLRQARPKRMEMLMQRTGVDFAAQLPEAMGDISPYNFEAIASGKTYAVADSEIDKVVKALKFKDRQEFEQAISAITLMQETRAGLLGRVGNVLSEQLGNVTGFSAIKKSQGYRQQLRQYRQTLGRSTAQTGDPLQGQQDLAPSRTAGLQKSLVDAGKSQRQLTKRLGDLGLNDTFEGFMKTGQWVQRASAEQLEILYREGFAQQITPEKLAALRQSLEKQGVTDVFLAYLNNGKFLNADAKKQEKVLNALRGTIGGNIGEQQLEDIQYLLKDNELTGLVSAYLKTGEFVTKASAQDKQAIATAVMGNNSTIEELENLHQNLPEGRFGKMKVAIQLFALGLRDGLGSLGEVVAEGLEKTPLRPASQKIIQSFQKFQNQFKSTAADMKAQISSGPIGKNITAVQQDYRKTKGRSLQGMTEAAGFGSLEEFMTAFRARLQQKDVPEQAIDRELLAVLKPDKRGLRAGTDKGGMNTRSDTLKVMADLLGLAGSDRERLASAGGYTTDAVDPIQVYFVKRLPKILVETTGSVMTAATKAAGRAGVYGLKLAIQRFSPKVVQQTAQFTRKVGFGLSNTVNRIRESLAGTPLSKMLLPLENALDLRTRQVGRFLDHQAEAIAQIPPSIPIVERVKNLFSSLSERFKQVVERMRQGIDAASSNASQLFAPLRSILGNVFGMMQGAFGRAVGAMRSAASKVTGGIGQGMMGRYRDGGGLAELDRKGFSESYGAGGIRLRSAKGSPAGRFLGEGEAVSTGSQRALGAERGSQPTRRLTPAAPTLTKPSSYPMLPDPWEETHAEGFFKGIARFTRTLKRAIPEASTQTVEFFRSVNEEGDRQLRSVRVAPLHQRILSRMGEAAKGGIEQMARAADRGAGIKPSQVKPPAKPPKIAGLLPPAGGMPPEAPRAANLIAQAFTRSAERVRAAWARTGEEVSGNTWGTMVRRAYRTGLRILGFISEASPGPSQQIRQNYARTADAVEQNFTQMEHAAHKSGNAIAATMKHSAETTKKVGLGHALGKFGAGAMKFGGARMAIGGAIGTAGFAAQSVASSLTTLGLLDEESSKAIFKFTELFSVITTIGGVVTPLIGAVIATLGAVIPVVVGIGGAIFAFLVSPIGIAAIAIVGTVLLVNEALKRFFGVDLLAPIVARAWGFAKQIAAPLTSAVDWIEAKWQGLVARFGPVLTPIIQPAVKVGQQLVSSLSENSPGPTFMIRQHWGYTSDDIQQNIAKIPAAAESSGVDIAKNLSPTINSLSPEAVDEILSKRVAYVDFNALQDSSNVMPDVLKARQFLEEQNLEIAKVFQDSRTGFDALGLKSTVGDQSKLVIRGTSDGTDAVADAQRYIGQDQYLANFQDIGKYLTKEVMSTGQKVDVTGHSLGGAVSQMVGATYPSMISDVRTYNSPGVGKNVSERFNALNNPPQVNHFIDDADVVSAGGESFIKGQVNAYSTTPTFSPVSSHMNLLAPGSAARWGESNDAKPVDLSYEQLNSPSYSARNISRGLENSLRTQGSSLFHDTGSDRAIGSAMSSADIQTGLMQDEIASALNPRPEILANWASLSDKIAMALNGILAPASVTGDMLVGALSENSPGPTFMIRQNWANTAASVQGSLMDMSGDAPAAGDKIAQAFKPDSGLGNVLGSALEHSQQLGDSLKLNQESVGGFLNLLGAQSTGDSKLDQMAIAKGMSGVEIGGGKSKLMDFGLMQSGYSKEQIEQVNKIAETLESPAKRLEDQMAKLQLALTELRVAMTAATLLQKPLEMMKKAPTVGGALSAVEPAKTLATGAGGVRNAITGKVLPAASGGIRNAVTGKVSESAAPKLSYLGKLKKELTGLFAKLSFGAEAGAGPLAVMAEAIGAIAASPLVQVGALLGVVLVTAETLTPGINLLGEALGFLGYAAGAVVGTVEGILAGLGVKEEVVSIIDSIKKAAAPLLYVKEALQRVSQRFHEARGSGEAFGKSVASAGIQAATTVQLAWLGFATWFMTMPLVSTAIAMGEGLIGALNCNPTMVIPLAWENAVLKVIEWIEKLPGVGSWAAGQLREGMKPDGWLSGAMKGVAGFVEDVRQKFKGLETAIALPKPPETVLPPPPPPPVPPKTSFRESLGDNMALLARGGDASAVFTPGIEQASYGVQFLTKSFRRFGSEAFDALKRLDFDAVGEAAQGFGDRAGFAVGVVVQGFRSMSVSAIAFGAASLIGLGPLNLGLLAAGLLLLAVATNFLGLRNIVMGGLKVAIGLLRVTVALVKGASQIIGGSIKVIAGAIALLGGNFDLIHEGIAQVRTGFHTIATGAAQGLRQMLGGAIQFVKGLLQGLRQIAVTVFGGFRGAITGVWGALKNLRSNVKLVSNILMTALAKPQEAWDRFLGVVNKVGNAIRRVTNSPQVVKDPTPTGSGLRPNRGSRLRQVPGSRLRPTTPDRNLGNDSLDPKSAASDAAYAVSNMLGMISPALAAPVMAIGTLVDGFSSLGDAFPVIAPLAQKGIASFMGLGFSTSFAAGMTGLLTAAQLLLANGMAIAGTAASAFWAAITGPLLPVVLVIGAIVLAVMALIHLFRNAGGVLKPFRQAWYAISDAVRDVFEGIGTALNRLGDAIASPFEPLLNLFGASGGSGLGGLIAGTFRIAINPILLVGKAIGLIIRLVGAVIIGIIEIAAMVTSTLLTPVARVISFLVDGFRGLGQCITQGFGGAIAAIARPIADTFQSLMITLRMVGDSLVEPFEPLLQMFGTSGAGGLGSLLGKAFKMLLSPLSLFASAIGLIIRLVGVVLVGAVQLVGALLKPLVSVLVMPVVLLGQMIRGIVWMAQSLIGMVMSSVQMLWSLMPPPLRWLIETAANGMGLAQGSAPPGSQPQRFASGGLVTGAGGIDQIPALLSNREFVVTPEATRQNYGFLQAINAGVPAEQALRLLPTTAPPMVKPMGGVQAIAPESSTPSISVILNFNGDIILTGGSGPELANEMMQHLEPKMEIAIRDALRDMVERMR